jgi:hypothetical protein
VNSFLPWIVLAFIAGMYFGFYLAFFVWMFVAEAKRRLG